MSINLSTFFSVPTIEDIDAELDRFNDAMNVMGYEATVGFWLGETVIEVQMDGEPIKTFYSGISGFLDDFRAYTDNIIDVTSVTRSEMKEIAA